MLLRPLLSRNVVKFQKPTEMGQVKACGDNPESLARSCERSAELGASVSMLNSSLRESLLDYTQAGPCRNTCDDVAGVSVWQTDTWALLT